jgi:hypothetical protein
MSRVYDSLIQEMQARFNRARSPSTQQLRAKADRATTLKDVLDQFQENFNDQMGRFKAAVAEGEAVVENDRRSAEETIHKLKDNIAALEEQSRTADERERQQQIETEKLKQDLSEAHRVLSEKEAQICSLMEKINACASQYQGEVEKRDQLLEGRATEITNLQAQLQRLSRGIKEMSSFFTQVDAFAASDSTPSPEVKATAIPVEATLLASQTHTQPSESSAPDQNQIAETMPAEFFDDLIAGFTEAVGPMAPFVVRDQARALGGSLESFPKSRVARLLDLLDDEIVEPGAKARFRSRFSRYISQSDDSTSVAA